MINYDINDDITYTGYMVGDYPLKKGVYKKVFKIFSIPLYKYSYTRDDKLDDDTQQQPTKIGFSGKSNKSC